MLKSLIVFVLCVFALTSSAQIRWSIKILDKTTQLPIEAATVLVENSTLTAYSDSLGVAHFDSIPLGAQNIIVVALNYYRKKIKLNTSEKNLSIAMESYEYEVEEVVVVSTRNINHNDNQATRIEVITDEEIEERMTDKPADISHIFKEQPGIQIQRTSATGGTMNVRLQGLRGKYVQVLRDGMPLFGSFANVIGVTQIPPLDIAQIEIIKGSASTLYGGDAIGGVINMITKQPSTKPVYDVLLNGESALAADAGFYAAQQFDKVGFSAYGIYRFQKEKDWDGDRYSETPRLQRFAFAPQLYFHITDKIKLSFGLSYLHEVRRGGALNAIRKIEDSTQTYFEQNNSQQGATNLRLTVDFDKNGQLTFKNTQNLFNRSLAQPFFMFRGTQLASNNEINYALKYKKHVLVLGVDVRYDEFRDKTMDSTTSDLSYTFLTVGSFLQYTYSPTLRTHLEAGFRLDYNRPYRVFPLPRIALSHQWTNSFSTRIGGGMGYKLPTVFQDESEEARYFRVGLASEVRPELSLGGTLDLTMKLPALDGVFISMKQLYFATRIFRPIVAGEQQVVCPTGICQEIRYTNGDGFQQSLGIENNFNLKYRGLNLNFVYTLTDNNFRLKNIRSIAPLTSKHIVSLFAEYGYRGFSAGVDAYYYSPVKLSTGKIGHQIWELGVKAQYTYRFFTIFCNLENILNMRQTSFGPIVHGEPNVNHPRFAEIYAPLEGRLFNLGIKIRLGELAKGKQETKNDD